MVALNFGSATRDRTWDILLNREALYRLSYRGIPENHTKKGFLIKVKARQSKNQLQADVYGNY